MRWTKVSKDRIANIPVSDLPADVGMIFDDFGVGNFYVKYLSICKNDVRLECGWTSYFRDKTAFELAAISTDAFCADLRRKAIHGERVELHRREEDSIFIELQFDLFYRIHNQTFDGVFTSAITLLTRYGLEP